MADIDKNALLERVAQITAHRCCTGTEHDPLNGKLHGYCVVCCTPFPCEYVLKDGDSIKTECGNCRKEFEVTCDVSVTYSTEKIKQVKNESN